MIKLEDSNQKLRATSNLEQAMEVENSKQGEQLTLAQWELKNSVIKEQLPPLHVHVFQRIYSNLPKKKIKMIELT
jgi:hypothetical protein